MVACTQPLAVPLAAPSGRPGASPGGGKRMPTTRHVRTLAARLAAMSEFWTPERLLELVQARVRRGPDGDGKTPMKAVLDGSDIVVTFHWRDDPQLYGVRFSASEAPIGPCTGGVCDSVEEWAEEVGWRLMEELDTGLVIRGRRTLIPDGVVELDVRHNDPAFQPRTGAVDHPLPGHYYRVVASPPEIH